MLWSAVMGWGHPALPCRPYKRLVPLSLQSIGEVTTRIPWSLVSLSRILRHCSTAINATENWALSLCVESCADGTCVCARARAAAGAWSATPSLAARLSSCATHSVCLPFYTVWRMHSAKKSRKRATISEPSHRRGLTRLFYFGWRVSRRSSGRGTCCPMNRPTSVGQQQS